MAFTTLTSCGCDTSSSATTPQALAGLRRRSAGLWTVVWPHAWIFLPNLSLFLHVLHGGVRGWQSRISGWSGDAKAPLLFLVKFQESCLSLSLDYSRL